MIVKAAKAQVSPTLSDEVRRGRVDDGGGANQSSYRGAFTSAGLGNSPRLRGPWRDAAWKWLSPVGDADAETWASIDAPTRVNVGPSRKRIGVLGITKEPVATVAAASGASEAPNRERLGVPTPFEALVVSASASVARGTQQRAYWCPWRR
jgi:hypothetical protein